MPKTYQNSKHSYGERRHRHKSWISKAEQILNNMPDFYSISINSDNLENVCRLCGKEEGVKFDIFGDADMLGNLKEKIYNYLPGIEVVEDDLSFKICNPCIHFVNSWHEFFLKSVAVKNFFENFEPVGCDANISNESSNSVEEPEINIEEMEVEVRPTVVEEDWVGRKRSRRMKQAARREVTEREQMSQSQREFLDRFKSVEIDGKTFYECDQCDHKYARKVGPATRFKHFQQHYHCHMNERIYCDICDKEFKEWDTLTRHKAVVHNIGEQPEKYICETCGRTFFLKYHLQRHIKREKGMYKQQCSACGMVVSSLSKHMTRVHAKEKNFKCLHCDMRWKSRQCVKRHMDEVHGSKDFPCDLCSATFKSKRYLQQHMRSKKHNTW